MKIGSSYNALNEWLPPFASGSAALVKATPQGVEEKGYYGIPMLKRPLWGWEIASYFFLEGISAGAYMIATMADLFGGGRYRKLVRAARYLSFATLLPCPVLLIADLGRPERFHHMLRVFKPTSPMNTGAWALTAYSLPVALLAGREMAVDGLLPEALQNLGQSLPAKFVEAVGLPCALTMISYPGVLLSTTSTPIWSYGKGLGVLFACSSITTGAAALTITLTGGECADSTLAKLEKVETIGSVTEALALTAYLVTAGKTAEPLTTGRYAKLFWAGAIGAGLIAPALLKAFAPPTKAKKGIVRSIVGSALSLVGGLALKWSMTHAGRVSGDDAEAARLASKAGKNNTGWSKAQS